MGPVAGASQPVVHVDQLAGRQQQQVQFLDHPRPEERILSDRNRWGWIEQPSLLVLDHRMGDEPTALHN